MPDVSSRPQRMPESPPATDSPRRLDALLRFPEDIEASYELENGPIRVAMLTRSIIVGLILYNLFNLTSFFLLPDILWLSFGLRLLVVTPSSLALVWLIRQVAPANREKLVMAGILNAIAAPIFLFWYSEAPLATYTFGELYLCLVFGNMLLLLRFRYALVFTFGSILLALAALGTKTGLDARLTIAFVLQFLTACLFSLYANWRVELTRCRAYLTRLDARAEVDEANLWRQRFESLSLTDALTGLANRRALQRRLDVWFTESQAVAMLMVDVDHFKPYNDKLGHPAGDDCLRRVAGCLAEVAGRAGAFACRFGGEEFAVVIHNGTEAESARLALSIVDAVHRLAIAHPGRPDGLDVVTVSIGVARVPSGRNSSPEAVIAAADSALYLAKNRGRNQWATSGEVAATLAASRAG